MQTNHSNTKTTTINETAPQIYRVKGGVDVQTKTY